MEAVDGRGGGAGKGGRKEELGRLKDWGCASMLGMLLCLYDCCITFKVRLMQGGTNGWL